jgi:hypothetical protein
LGGPDQGRLPPVRIGRCVRIRRTDLDQVLAQGTTAVVEPAPTPAAPVEARDLSQALDRARRLLGRRTAARRAELADGPQELSDAVATALHLLADDAGREASVGL